MEDYWKCSSIPGRRSIFVRLLSVMLSLSIISGGVILLGISFKSPILAADEMFITGLNCFSLVIPFACVVSFFVAKAFTEPIMQLIEGTKAVSEGKFDYNLEINTGDEIEELANTFAESKAEMESFIHPVAPDLKSPLVTTQGVTGMLRKDYPAECSTVMSRPIRVLHVDDEPADLEITKILLKRYAKTDFKIVSILSAEEALKKLEREDFDAVISDYQMPGMNGMEFLEAVRKSGKHASIPFVLFTGKGGAEVAAEAFNKGADRYIAKNGNPTSQCNELAHTIQELANRE